MNEQETWNHFTSLWNDIDKKDEFYNRQPHLAHYTSIANAEKILRSNELWFANPLYMNDHEEIAFGVNLGWQTVKSSQEITQACGSPARTVAFLAAFERCYLKFANEHVMDTYVLCTSEHAKDDNDGLLSMWRGYGGNGSGVALVLDAGRIKLADRSSFILAWVHYGTSVQRGEWVKAKMKEFATLLAGAPVPDDQLHVAADALFERIKLFSLFTKHRGFAEEREWRAVYMPNRDTDGILLKFFGYSIGGLSAEPRLKLPLGPIEGIADSDLMLENLVNRIILGPTSSSPLAVAGFHRVLDITQHGTLKDRVRASGIPFRSRL